MTGRRRFRVPADSAERRLDHLLAEWFPDRTRSALKRWIEAGHVIVDGAAAAKAGQAIKPGATIDVEPPETVDRTPAGVDYPLDVIHEDDALVVVDKPAGLVVHPGHGRDETTLVHALLGRGTALSSIGAPMRPGIVHRLDRDTSGVILVAKTDASHRALQTAFAERTVEKRYHALVWGRPREYEGVEEGPIGRSRAHPTKMAVRRGGRNARTEWKTLEEMPGFALLEARPHTGRTHQIRIHMSTANHPIVGDELYGGGGTRGVQDPPRRKALRDYEGMALHAASIAFDHPGTDKRVRFRARRPAAFESLLEALRT